MLSLSHPRAVFSLTSVNSDYSDKTSFFDLLSFLFFYSSEPFKQNDDPCEINEYVVSNVILSIIQLTLKKTLEETL